MSIVQNGIDFKIYRNGIKTFDKIPTGTYRIMFSQTNGFYLSQIENMFINEKVYGVHKQKVQKVFRAFNNSYKNIGTILCGDKGIGKSFFAKMLAIRSISIGLPVILADEYFDGIAEFIGSINQDVMILFDEFDKKFDKDDQNMMLSLFNGTDSGKKLFVITCNYLGKLSDFVVNRTGRFRYLFKFKYPVQQEVRQYLMDKIKPEYQKEIEKVVMFSIKVNLTYDSLETIADELNFGDKFEDIIEDLNIIEFGDDAVSDHIAKIIMKNGEEIIADVDENCSKKLLTTKELLLYKNNEGLVGDDDDDYIRICIKFKELDVINDSFLIDENQIDDVVTYVDRKMKALDDINKSTISKIIITKEKEKTWSLYN